MIFLKPQNMIVEEAIGTRLFDDPPRREACDITVSDFDDVRFKVLVAPGAENLVQVHISMGAIGKRLKEDLYGAEIMETVYPGLSIDPVAGYDFAVGFDLDAPPMDPQELLTRVSQMRRHLLAAPLTKALQGLKDGTGAALPMMTIETRANEAMFIKPAADRCTVIYALNFSEETDKAVARVMLQQFAKESSKVNGSPPCQFSEGKNPPMEIRDVPTAAQYGASCGFISFVIFPAHVKDEPKFEKSVTMLANFRNYLHYHIKASKTYLHMRMRSKVQGWLQVLNRAVHEQEKKEAKTASGKTFKRASAK